MIMSIEEVVTELTMSYSHKLHLVLEGDADRKFWLSMFEDAPQVNAVCVWGADRVVETVAKVENEEKLRESLKVVGVVDRDYREPLNTLPESSNVLLTDLRDLECMMIDTPAFSRVVREIGTQEKIRSIGGVAGVKQKIIDAAGKLGALRFYSQFTSAHWNFKQIDLAKFVDKKTLDVDEGKLIAHLRGCQRPGHKKLSPDTLVHAQRACNEALCSKKKKYFVHELLLCRGHDLTNLLSYAARSCCGSTNDVDSERVESMLRIGFVQYFPRTRLHQNMSEWLKVANLEDQVAFAH